MKFRVKNVFGKEAIEREDVSPFDCDKFMDGRIVEFNTDKELFEFLTEAYDTIIINYDDVWTDVSVWANKDTGELVIDIGWRSLA